MIVLDTMVLVYATGKDHPLKDPCRRLVEAIGAGRARATTTPETIQEFVHVRSRRRPRREAASIGRSYADVLAPLLIVDGSTLTDGLALFERSKKLGAFDAILAAATITVQAEALVSADRAFDEVRGLRRWDPAGTELARFLSAD